MIQEDGVEPRLGTSISVEEDDGVSFDERPDMKDVDLQSIIVVSFCWRVGRPQFVAVAVRHGCMDGFLRFNYQGTSPRSERRPRSKEGKKAP